MLLKRASLRQPDEPAIDHFRQCNPSPARQRMAALPRMFWYTVTGRSDGFGRLFAISLATLYVASPIDLFPEAIFLLPGLLDDVVVATWIAGAVLSETERFLLWEQGRAPGRRMKPEGVIDGDVV